MNEMNSISIHEAIQLLDSDNCKQKLISLYASKSRQKIKIPKTDKLAGLFSVLANPLRLKIIMLIAQEPLPVCILSKLIETDQTLISHHLQLLKNKDLVRVEVIGRFRIYRLNKEKIPVQLLELFRIYFEKRCDNI